MATIPTFPILPGPKVTFDSRNNNGAYNIGNTDPENTLAGAFALHASMSVDWVGSLTFLGRNSVHKAGVDDLGFVGPWPFRAYYLNGQPSDPNMMRQSTSLTSTSAITIPASGFTIAVAVSCTAGSCALYWLPIIGQAAP